MFLADHTWPDAEAIAATSELMLCLGSWEQHGPHLPLDTDTVIVKWLAEQWARGRRDRLVGPVIPLGASGEHADFGGTISIGTAATAQIIVETARSCRPFRRVIVACWHGGNADAISSASATLSRERPVTFWMPKVPGDAHAGRVETSMMLAIAPHRVRMNAAAAGNTEEISTLMPRLRDHGVRAVSPNGVLGDPAGATAAEGEATLRSIVDQFEKDVT